jgi:hypothetical protein
LFYLDTVLGLRSRQATTIKFVPNPKADAMVKLCSNGSENTASASDIYPRGRDGQPQGKGKPHPAHM